MSKKGLIIGFAAGYVLGAKAGRQRYEQIREWWQKLNGNAAVQRVTENAKQLAGEAGRKGLEAVQGGVGKVTGAVRNRLGENGSDVTSGYATGT
jgi:hypothetical protein